MADEVRIWDEHGQEVRRDHAENWDTWEKCAAAPGFPKGLVQFLKDAERGCGFPAPTSIQSFSWPALVTGKDFIGVAKTGSGKTLAFLLPGFMWLKKNRKSDNPVDASVGPAILALTPTRELCYQIYSDAEKFGTPVKISAACAYGGAPKWEQEQKFRESPDTLIATPGRLSDFLRSRSVSLDMCRYVVLDEADRMLDMGFDPQVKEILDWCPRERQMSMFTATWAKEVRALADKYITRPVQVQVGSMGITANKDITQHIEVVSSESEKKDKLNKILENCSGACLIFCNTKRKVKDLTWDLHPKAVELHGDLQQKERDQAMHKFKTGAAQILIATDVASRGLDMRAVSCVVNYDAPKNCAEDYVHRIGRTGRGGDKGDAHTFLAWGDEKNAAVIIGIMENSGVEPPESLKKFAAVAGGGSRWGSSGDSWGESKKDDMWGSSDDKWNKKEDASSGDNWWEKKDEPKKDEWGDKWWVKKDEPKKDEGGDRWWEKKDEWCEKKDEKNDDGGANWWEKKEEKKEETKDDGGANWWEKKDEKKDDGGAREKDDKKDDGGAKWWEKKEESYEWKKDEAGEKWWENKAEPKEGPKEESKEEPKEKSKEEAKEAPKQASTEEPKEEPKDEAKDETVEDMKERADEKKEDKWWEKKEEKVDGGNTEDKWWEKKEEDNKDENVQEKGQEGAEKEEKEEKEEKMEEGEKEEKKGMENAQEYAMEENAGVANKAKSSDVAAAVAAECDVVMKDEDAGAKRLAEENSECSPPAKVARIAGEGEAAATSGDVAMDADSGATKPAKTDGQQKSADAAGAIEGSGEKSTEEVSGGANKAAETDVLLDSRDEDKRMDVVGGEA